MRRTTSASDRTKTGLAPPPGKRGSGTINSWALSSLTGTPNCVTGPLCGTSDFNGDGASGLDDDIAHAQVEQRTERDFLADQPAIERHLHALRQQTQVGLRALAETDAPVDVQRAVAGPRLDPGALPTADGLEVDLPPVGPDPATAIALRDVGAR